MDENVSYLIKQVDLPSLAEREGVQLRSSGRQLAGLCPFHSEKTPSLIHGSPEEKAYCLWSFKGYPALERGQLFRQDFDFGKWLRVFINNGATSNVEIKKAM